MSVFRGGFGAIRLPAGLPVPAGWWRRAPLPASYARVGMAGPCSAGRGPTDIGRWVAQGVRGIGPAAACVPAHRPACGGVRVAGSAGHLGPYEPGQLAGDRELAATGGSSRPGQLGVGGVQPAAEPSTTGPASAPACRRHAAPPTPGPGQRRDDGTAGRTAHRPTADRTRRHTGTTVWRVALELLADPRVRLSAGAAGVLITAHAARAATVGRGEARAFRAVNGLTG